MKLGVAALPLLLLAAAPSCETALEPGRYACVDDHGCPPGWACQRRGGQPLLCYDDPSGEHCGDGVKNDNRVKKDNEECDKNDLDGKSCQTLGYYEGTLSCTDECKFSLACKQYCGDGIVNGPEECDGPAGPCLSAATGYSGGALGCNASCRRTFEKCIAPWNNLASSPTQERLYGVWGSSATNVFMVGARGTILRYDGASFTSTNTGMSDWLYGVWGSSPTNVFVVGERGIILHYDGAWGPPVTPAQEFLYGIWGSAANDIFAVGASGRVLHFDGNTWTPSQPAMVDLYGVWGSSANDVYAVGIGGTILHYDGTWKAVSSPTTEDLLSVGGTSATNVFAVGAGGTILRFAGGSWSPMSSGTIATLKAVWSGASRVLAAGSDGVILQFDGRSWALVASPTQNELLGAWDTFIVGKTGTVLRSNSASFGPVTSPTSSDLQDVWGSPSGERFAVGTAGTIIHENEKGTWLPMTSNTTQDLFGVWGSSGTDVHAVGTTVMAHLAGTGNDWTAVASPYYLRGVWGTSASNVFGAGWGGTILQFDGMDWKAAAIEWGTIIAPSARSLQRMWGTTPSTVFSVGSGGTILEHQATWAPMTSPTSSNLQGVWGTSRGSMFAVGWVGTILHYDGSAWSPMASGTKKNLQGVWGRSSSDVFAVGDVGTVLHYDGASWEPMASGTSQPLNAVWGGPDGRVVAVGNQGAIVALADSSISNAGPCARLVPIYCGSATAQAGDTTGQPQSSFSGYSCGARQDTAPETFYRLDSPITGRITVTLTPHQADLDLVVLGDDRACPPALCLAASQSAGTGPEEVTLQVTTGKTYYIVVDGYDGAVSGYTLKLACDKG